MDAVCFLNALCLFVIGCAVLFAIFCIIAAVVADMNERKKEKPDDINK